MRSVDEILGETDIERPDPFEVQIKEPDRHWARLRFCAFGDATVSELIADTSRFTCCQAANLGFGINSSAISKSRLKNITSLPK